ncbi:hypothetical protein ABZZ48_32670, partial [Kitasatospora indigofera]
MDWLSGVFGFAAWLGISVVTAPVGVSGAVFLLLVQVSVLGVPSPAVTPTTTARCSPASIRRWPAAPGRTWSRSSSAAD